MTGVAHRVRRRASVRSDRRGRTMRVLSFPRDPNPYQELLHDELRRRGAIVSYLGSETPSQSLNIALLPLRIAIGRLRGARVVHLHWLYPFALHWTISRWLRPLRELLLSQTLGVARICGVRVVWTLHNVVPHRAVFADDLRARRRLVNACDLVIAHSPSALDELRRRTGAAPRRTRVIPLGPYAPRSPRVPRRASRHVAFFGKVESYKGVEELLRAFAALPVVAACGSPSPASVPTCRYVTESKGAPRRSVRPSRCGSSTCRRWRWTSFWPKSMPSCFRFAT